MERGWSRLLDGESPWGTFDLRSDRIGTTRYRLVVYPPGTNTEERRRLRRWRSWPWWGGVGFVLFHLFAAQVISPWEATILAAGAYIGSGLLAYRQAGRTRRHVRTLVAVVLAGRPEPVAVARRNRIRTYAEVLADADEMCRLGRISALQHEAIWWQVYDQIAPPAGGGSASGSATRNTRRGV